MWALIIRKVFTQLKCLLSCYVDVPKFLKAVLSFMYASYYPSYCESEIMKHFVTSKIITEINDNASRLPCFK